MKRGTDETELVNAVFASVFTDGIPRGRIQWGGQQPASGWKLTQGLLAQTQPMQGHGTAQAAPKVAEKACWCPCKVTFKHFERVWRLGGDSQQLEKGKYHTYLWKRKERWSGDLQNSQTHFTPWDNYGIRPLGILPWVRDGEEGDWDSQHRGLGVNHAWTSWLPCVIKLSDLWTSGEQGILFGLASARLPTVSHNVLVSTLDVSVWVGVPPGG